MKRELCYYFQYTQKLGPSKIPGLFSKAQALERLYEDFEKTNKPLYDIKKRLERYEEQGIHYVSIVEEEYPFLLSQISSPPLGLFFKGRLPDQSKSSIAVVGSRNCTIYGREIARNFSRQFSEVGLQVISGMAMGIDSFAHEGALLGPTPTYAVLGTGVDVCYPRRNGRLYQRIMQTGGIISEFEPGTQALPYNFPVRNRIISGLSRALLIVEARENSGSLITHKFAIDQGRDTYAIPGRLGDDSNKGCNHIIKDSAHLVDQVSDILNNENILPKSNKEIIEKSKIVLETKEKIVYANLRCESRYLDDIAKDADISVSEALKTLISLECKGLCIQVVPNYYIRVES